MRTDSQQKHYKCSQKKLLVHPKSKNIIGAPKVEKYNWGTQNKKNIIGAPKIKKYYWCTKKFKKIFGAPKIKKILLVHPN